MLLSGHVACNPLPGVGTPLVERVATRHLAGISYGVDSGE